MKKTFEENLNKISAIILAFTTMSGIFTDEFIIALNNSIVSHLNDIYQRRGIIFDIENTPIDTDAINEVSDTLCEVFALAMFAKRCGITPKDLGME